MGKKRKNKINDTVKLKIGGKKMDIEDISGEFIRGHSSYTDEYGYVVLVPHNTASCELTISFSVDIRDSEITEAINTLANDISN